MIKYKIKLYKMNYNSKKFWNYLISQIYIIMKKYYQVGIQHVYKITWFLPDAKCKVIT